LQEFLKYVCLAAGLSLRTLQSRLNTCQPSNVSTSHSLTVLPHFCPTIREFALAIGCCGVIATASIFSAEQETGEMQSSGSSLMDVFHIFTQILRIRRNLHFS
jgi:hypothetical protein